MNTVHWSPCGQLLVSGSDDLTIRFWDWQAGKQLLNVQSGHRGNVFQAQLMPESSNRTLVSCAADGAVRLTQLGDRGTVESKRLAQHAGRAHKLAITGPATLLSCGEDGQVGWARRACVPRARTHPPTHPRRSQICQFDLREPGSHSRRLLVRSAVHGRPLELNSVAVRAGSEQMVVGGGDEFARV